MSVASTQAILDIFNFRDEVIGDYRRYIESFLKIRDSYQFATRQIILNNGVSTLTERLHEPS